MQLLNCVLLLAAARMKMTSAAESVKPLVLSAGQKVLSSAVPLFASANAPFKPRVKPRIVPVDQNLLPHDVRKSELFPPPANLCHASGLATTPQNMFWMRHPQTAS